MALLDIYVLATDITFRNRVRSAVVKAAVAIVGENPGSKPALADKRHALGMKALSDGGSFVLDQFAWAVAAQAPADDTAIENAVAAVWNDLSGVTFAEA